MGRHGEFSPSRRATESGRLEAITTFTLMEELVSNDYPGPYPSAPVAVPGNGGVPLDQPLYGASFGQAIKRFFTKYATFSGRASRSEYWWVQLFNFIIVAVLYG